MLTKKASKEAYNKNVNDKMQCIGNIFLTKQEVSMYESIQTVLLIFLHNDVEWLVLYNDL